MTHVFEKVFPRSGETPLKLLCPRGWPRPVNGKPHLYLQVYALKALSKGYIIKCGMQKSLVNEKDILMLCNSPFITRLYETYKGEQLSCRDELSERSVCV